METLELHQDFLNFNQSDANVLYKIYIYTYLYQPNYHKVNYKQMLFVSNPTQEELIFVVFFGACNIWHTKSNIKALHTDSQRRIQIHLIGGSQVTLPSSGCCANSPLVKMSIDTIYNINHHRTHPKHLGIIMSHQHQSI